jgi:predicted peroxiredoxin
MIEMAKLLISITHAKDDMDRATVGYVVANASAASAVETVIFLSTEGVRLCQQGYSDDIHEEGFSPLKQLMDDFVDAGGMIWVCSPCFKKRGLDESKLVAGATIVGGAKAVEFLTTGASSLTY